MELVARFNEVKFNWDETVVILITREDGSYVSAKGKEHSDSTFIKGLEYVFYGRWGEYTNRRTKKTEKQFQFSSYALKPPTTMLSISRGLMNVNGIGYVTSKKILKELGEDTEQVKQVLVDKELLAKHCSILNESQVEKVSEFFTKWIETGTIQVELGSLLAGHGFPKDLAKRAVDEFGANALEAVSCNPFCLISFRGVGFLTCDKFYLSQGKDPTAEIRKDALFLYCFTLDATGSTWLDERFIKAKFRSVFSDEESYWDSLGRLHASGAVQTYHYSKDESPLQDLMLGHRFIALKNDSAIEGEIVDTISAMLNESCVERITLAENTLSHHQQAVARLVLDPGSRICILSGRPGTGKTYVATQLIKQLKSTNRVMVCAPTGKAAMRLNEVGEGVFEATTVHRMLGSIYEDGVFTFTFDKMNRLDVDYIFLDEFSMLDQKLFSRILQAMPSNAKLICIGDIGQLPPIGKGCPMRDLVSAGVLNAELTEIRRNSGAIVKACHAIATGDAVVFEGNLTHDNDFDNTELIFNIMHELSENPIEDCQIVVGVNEKTLMSREVLNLKFQSLLNGENVQIIFDNHNELRRRFALNDKVVCLQNNEYAVFKLHKGEYIKAPWQQYVANGDLGRVVQIELNRMLVKTTLGVVVCIPLAKNRKDKPGCSFDLAYAITCHKLQGSSAKYIFIPIDEGAKRVYSREWWYTAISRAEKECYLVGEKRVFESSRRRQAIETRRTFLSERIQCKLNLLSS